VPALVAVVAEATALGQQVEVVAGLGAADAPEVPDPLDAAIHERIHEPHDNQGHVGVTADQRVGVCTQVGSQAATGLAGMGDSRDEGSDRFDIQLWQAIGHDAHCIVQSRLGVASAAGNARMGPTGTLVAACGAQLPVLGGHLHGNPGPGEDPC
jgi:hypothetical protein